MQRPKPACCYSILFHISRILVPLLIPLVSSTRAIHLIKASRGKDHFSFFTVYTTHSAVQLCTDCGNLSPSVSERSSLLSGARFARARVRRAANVRVYTPINVHHGCVHTPHSNPCASWSGWLALFPTIMRVLCARVCTKVDTRETEKRLPSNDAHDTEFNNPPSKHAYRDFVLRNCFSSLL